MAKNLEHKMVCKNCNQVEIGKDPADGKWYEVNNDTTLHQFKCSARKQKSYVTQEQFNELKAIVDNHGEAIKALVGTSDQQTLA